MTTDNRPYPQDHEESQTPASPASLPAMTPVLRCPVHGIPDCSALINGCVLPRELSYCPRADVDAAIEGVADTYTPEGVAIWWADWIKQGPVERARKLIAASGYGGMAAT